MAFFGSLADRSMESYLESLPGVRPCPPRMNPASWMLDVLSGSDSSAAQADSSEAQDGETLQARLLKSAAWAKAVPAIDAACTPASGVLAVRFDSTCARTFPAQLRIVMERTLTAYNRNTGYIWTKLCVLFGLNILFGTIFYHTLPSLRCANVGNCQNDSGGVQAVVSVIFLGTLFFAIVSLNTLLPVLFRERAVFYRERFSAMYRPEAHALSYAIAEVPWLALSVLLCITPLYFMVGLPPKAAGYWFYVLGECLLGRCRPVSTLTLTQWSGWSATFSSRSGCGRLLSFPRLRLRRQSSASSSPSLFCLAACTCRSRSYRMAHPTATRASTGCGPTTQIPSATVWRRCCRRCSRAQRSSRR